METIVGLTERASSFVTRGPKMLASWNTTANKILYAWSEVSSHIWAYSTYAVHPTFSYWSVALTHAGDGVAPKISIFQARIADGLP